MKRAVLEKRHGKRYDRNRAEEENPLIRAFSNQKDNPGEHSDNGNTSGEPLPWTRIWSTERPSEHCTITVQNSYWCSAANLKMAKIDKIKHAEINERSGIARQDPSHDLHDGEFQPAEAH